jgi:hypothetical protein
LVRNIVRSNDVTSLMADYYQLIARALANLGNADEPQRVAVYGCVRAALVKELSSLTPPPSESEIARERMSLEAAIRDIEADATRRSRVDAGPAWKMNPELEPSLPEDSDRPTPGHTSSARAARSTPSRENGIQGPESIAANRAGNHEFTPRSAEALAAINAYRESVAEHLSKVPASLDRDSLDTQSGAKDHRTVPPHRRLKAELKPRHMPPRLPMGQRQSDESIAPTRSHYPLKAIVSFLSAFVVVAMTLLVYYYGHQLGGIFVRQSETPAQHDPARLEPEVVGNIDPHLTGRSSTASQSDWSQKPRAQRAALYEEDPADDSGKRYAGSVVWETERASPDQPLAVRAQLEIPERRLSMTMSVRPNPDKTLSASLSVEIVFKVPEDFPFGGISNVLGIVMKESEDMRGAPLAIAGIKITSGVFLIGLSATDSDKKSNQEMLDDRPWFDIPIVYENKGRAILAIEKGPPGEAAFKEAFATWK